MTNKLDNLNSTMYRWLSSKFELEGNRSNRILPMEGLRGLAILLVFTYHYYGLVWAHMPAFDPVISALGTVGGSGVDLFFVLSGYLIYGAVSKQNFNFGDFLRRRSERIYPAFLVVLSFYIFMSFLSGTHGSAAKESWDRIPANNLQAVLYIAENICFLPGILPIQPILNVAWSLSYEWFFYLSLPLVFALTGFRNLSRQTRAICVLSVVATVVTLHLALPLSFYRSGNPSRTCHIRAIMFLGGVLVYELNKLRPLQREAKWLRILSVVVGVITLGCLVASPKAIDGDLARSIRRETILSTLMFLSYSPLVYFAIRGEVTVAKALSYTPLRWLGNMSYSFYLFHGVPLHALGIVSRAIGTSGTVPLYFLLSVVGLPLALGVASASSAVLFVLVERPFSLSKSKKRVVAAAASESPLRPSQLPSVPLLNQFEN